MGDALLVSSRQTERDFFRSGLMKGDFFRIAFAPGGNEARRILLMNSFDLILINTPLRDEFGFDLAMDVAEKTNAVVLMVVKEDEKIWDGADEAGVFIMRRPLQRYMFDQCIKLICIVNKRVMSVQDENRKLQSQMNEIRVVSRAKCLLIERENMTEEAAHRFVEKQAMDTRRSRFEVAKEILERSV